VADDAGELDTRKAGIKWYVRGDEKQFFATKGAAIAHAWTLTAPGGTRPDVRWIDSPKPRAKAKTPPPWMTPKYEAKITVDRGDDAVDFTWGALGETLVARPIPRTVTIELEIPFLHGVSRDLMYETVRNTLHGEARARGLELISDASLEMLTNGMGDRTVIRATAKARPKT
jgi:hypothetical protein